MSGSTLESTLQEVRDYAERICFHVMGEPLQHPEFPAFIALAQKHSVPIEITTNGTLLNETAQEALLNPTVVQVNFSLQSFLDNFPDANPETYLKNIFSFCHRARNLRPDLYINLRLWNLSDAGSASALNELFFSRIEKEFSTTLNRNVDPGFKKSKNIVDRIYLHFDSRFEWPNPKSPHLSEQGTCHGVRSHIAIHADGKVVPCCLDKEANIVLGRLPEQSFVEIISGVRAEAMRRGFENGKLVEDLCQRCTYVQRFN
jgi:radical SAM protein with 4Fe4S-binding SPASM domain